MFLKLFKNFIDKVKMFILIVTMEYVWKNCIIFSLIYKFKYICKTTMHIIVIVNLSIAVLLT